MTIQQAFVDSVDQDQTAQNVQSDLWSTLSTVFVSRLLLSRSFILLLYCILSQLKTTIYLFGGERLNSGTFNLLSENALDIHVYESKIFVVQFGLKIVTSNSSLSLSVCYPFGELSAILIKFEIVISKCLQFQRV